MLNCLTILFTASLFLTGGAPLNHPLDGSHAAFQDGRFDDAIRLAEVAISSEGSAVAYNALALSYEACGQWPEALNASAHAMALAPDDVHILTNHRRECLRAFLASQRVGAASTLATCVCVIILASQRRRIVRAWREHLLRRQYRKISVTSSELLVDGSSSNGPIYPDAQELALLAQLQIPVCLEREATPLLIEVRDQQGGLLKRVQHVAASTHSGETQEIHTLLSDALPRLRGAGKEGVVTVLTERFRLVLLQTRLEVVTLEALRRNLTIVERVVLVNDQELDPTDEALTTDTEHFEVHLTLAPRRYCPTKYTGMRLRAQLISPEGTPVSEQVTPLELIEGIQQIAIEHPIHGAAVAEQPGNWQFRLLIDEHCIDSMPLTFATRAAMISGVEVRRASLAGVGPRGGTFAVTRFCQRRATAIAPLFSLTSPVVNRFVSIPLSVVVCMDGEPVAECTDSLPLLRSELEWAPGLYELSEVEQKRDELELAFIVWIGERLVTTTMVLLRQTERRCANAQGQLLHGCRFSIPDAEAEAQAILSIAEARP